MPSSIIYVSYYDYFDYMLKHGGCMPIFARTEWGMDKYTITWAVEDNPNIFDMLGASLSNHIKLYDIDTKKPSDASYFIDGNCYILQQNPRSECLSKCEVKNCKITFNKINHEMSLTSRDD